MKRLIKCTLCCDKTFQSKLEFAEHLAQVLANLSCPVCDNKWASLSHLIEHLNIDDCQPAYGFDQYEDDKKNIPIMVLKNSTITVPISEPKDERHGDDNNEETIVEEHMSYSPAVESVLISEGRNAPDLDDNNMYIQIYDKANETTCIQGQTQKLELVNGDGQIEQFVIMSSDADVKLANVENAVVTKQNSDGTISLQSIKELNNESETVTVIAPSENEAEDNQEELYSCNTCGVSFSSVFDHIQNYHNDQEVVVEEPFDEDSNFQADPLTPRQEVTKRVITDTGNIVNATVINEEEDEVTFVSAEESDNTRQQGRRFIQIEEFCDSVVKNINPEENSGPYHTVMLKEKMANGELVKNYYCMTCNICADNLDEFKNQPCKIPKYPCPHCPVAYENSKSLCAHMKVHKVKPEEILSTSTTKMSYFCEICNTIFQSNKSLKLHKRMHDPVKSRPIEPPIENIDGSEGSQDRYRCDICDKMIPSDFKVIHQNSHKNNEQLNCGICNKKFLSHEYLEMHMSVHNVDKVAVNRTDKSFLYSCLYCDRRFAKPHEKVKHERIHTGEKPHSCEICGKSFRVAYCLTLHMRTHTGLRPYACPFCTKRFKAHSVYNHHLLTHSEVRRYKCPFCPKAFKTSVQLAGHKNSHTKPFSCQQCNRPFASLYAVRVHTETHARQNNLKFSCSLCGASYARTFALKDHMKKVHLTNVRSLTKASEGGTLQVVETLEEAEMSTIEGKVLTQEITDLTGDQLITD